jgi:hypothetical protein
MSFERWQHPESLWKFFANLERRMIPSPPVGGRIGGMHEIGSRGKPCVLRCFYSVPWRSVPVEQVLLSMSQVVL